MDYTSGDENNDLVTYAQGEYYQQQVYLKSQPAGAKYAPATPAAPDAFANAPTPMVDPLGNGSTTTHSERLMQLTDTTAAQNGNGGQERKLYIHEDPLGTTKKFTKGDGTEFEYLKYDAWGLPAQPNKLVNNDHGSFIAANFTGHPFDTVLSFYYAEARFYDPGDRTFVSRDQMEQNGNNYNYCFNNPTSFWDPTGMATVENEYIYQTYKVNENWDQFGRNGEPYLVVDKEYIMTSVTFTNLNNTTVYTYNGLNFSANPEDLLKRQYSSVVCKVDPSYFPRIECSMWSQSDDTYLGKNIPAMEEMDMYRGQALPGAVFGAVLSLASDCTLGLGFFAKAADLGASTLANVISNTGNTVNVLDYGLSGAESVDKLIQGKLSNPYAVRDELLGYAPFYGTNLKYNQLQDILGLSDNVQFKKQ